MADALFRDPAADRLRDLAQDLDKAAEAIERDDYMRQASREP